MFELPNELAIFRFNQQQIEFWYGFGTVVKATVYSHSDVSGGGGDGGGGGGTISTTSGGYTSGYVSSVKINPIHIRTKTTEVLDVWVHTDAGREVNCKCINTNIGAREGHYVHFILGRQTPGHSFVTLVLNNYAIDDGWTYHKHKCPFTPQMPPMEEKRQGLFGGLFRDRKKEIAEQQSRWRAIQDDFEERLHQHNLKIAKFVTEGVKNGTIKRRSSEMRWYYTDSANQTVGPLPFAELKTLAEKGTVRPATSVLEEGTSDWRPFSSVV